MESRNTTTTHGGEGSLSPLDRKADVLPVELADDTISPAVFPLYDLIPEIVDEANMNTSFWRVISNLRHSEPRRKGGAITTIEIDGHQCSERQVRYARQREALIAKIRQQISTGTFKITQLKSFQSSEGYKVRTVQAPNVSERVGCHAIMEVVERHLAPLLIEHTAASIKGRGPHGMFHDICDLMEHDPTIQYYYQCDFKGYYDHIVHSLMLEQIERYIQDPILLPMLRNFVTVLGGDVGISKGLRSSQFFGNLYLNDIDHRMMELTDGMYFRFCDDTFILGRSKRDLWRIRDALHDEAAALGLIIKPSIKPSEKVAPISSGMDALGYVNYGTHALIRKRTKVTAARKLAKVKSRKRRQQIIGSFKGMACHADCKHLYYTLTHHHMKKFSEMGVTYTPADGKKRFPGKVMRLGAIQNKVIEIHDYQDDITTSHGDGRYLVSFRDTATGEWGKFFTSSEELKNILDQVSDMEDGFPFETVIQSELFDGNKMKYKFT